jgi:DNA-nicking Smr family endonuclease
MNFGDILDQWEESNKKKKSSPTNKSSKKANADHIENPGRIEKEVPKPELKKIDPMILWMRRYGVEDKDSIEEEKHFDSAERRKRLLNKKPDATIDLHGLIRDEAWTALEAFFQDARRRSFEKLLIIHGKGNHSNGDAVLKRTVRDFIERCSFAGESGQGTASQGASGATWVLLKDRK